jgi:hypothetical protein
MLTKQTLLAFFIGAGLGVGFTVLAVKHDVVYITEEQRIDPALFEPGHIWEEDVKLKASKNIDSQLRPKMWKGYIDKNGNKGDGKYYWEKDLK